MITLRETYPTARKARVCGFCCVASIQPGTKYRRTTNVYDGRLYDWVECLQCSALLGLVWEWAGRPDEGVGEDSFHEWARDHEQDAEIGHLARAYLNRRWPDRTSA